MADNQQNNSSNFGSAALLNANEKYTTRMGVSFDGGQLNTPDPTHLDNVLSLDKTLDKKNQLFGNKNDDQKKYFEDLKKGKNPDKAAQGGIYNKFVDKAYKLFFKDKKSKGDNYQRYSLPVGQTPADLHKEAPHAPQAVSAVTTTVNLNANIGNETEHRAGPRIFETTKDLLYEDGISVQDKIAPSSLEVDWNDIKINDTYVRTIFVIDYKKAYPGILESLINYEEPIDVSMYYYPIDSGEIVEKIRRKIAELEAALNMDLEGGKVPNAYIKVALQDALRQQEALASGAEKYFHFALYITIKSNDLQKLNNMTQTVLSDLSSKEMAAKIPTSKMESAFKSALPYAYDREKKTRNMDTSSIAMTFPFTSSDLSQEKGILYGINTYNRGLIVFDRFSMPNANMIVLAASGGGKSYFVKLEILRSLMLGTECLVIDPENEYEELCKGAGGSYLSFSQDGRNKLNPFELPAGVDSSEDELRLKELSLQGFFKIVFGALSTRDVSVLDRAVRMAYREKGITNDKATFVNDPPRMEDLYKVLRAMEEMEAQEMALKLERFLVGSASGIFDKRTNIEINNPFTVFSIRDLSEELRPLAMYLMLDFIWTKIKRERKRRILVIDEAWILMKYPDSALFINSIAKRARKYYLGLTTITQDVQDFLGTDYGRAIVTNSSIQILFRQSPAGIDYLSGVFNLSDGEKAFLLSVPPGNGLFFAGNNHVSINVKASPVEHMLVTSNPTELEMLKKQGFI
jgi:conjugal transfer ATP-binding protein TraC